MDENYMMRYHWVQQQQLQRDHARLEGPAWWGNNNNHYDYNLDFSVILMFPISSELKYETVNRSLCVSSRIQMLSSSRVIMSTFVKTIPKR